MLKKILIVDDEKNILRSLRLILQAEGFKVFVATNIKEAKKILTQEVIPFFLLDVFLPDGDGIDFIKDIRSSNPHSIIIMISGHASIKMAVEATQKGADDFFEKPLSKDKLMLTLNNFLKRLELEQKYLNLEQTTSCGDLIGKSVAMEKILEQIEKIAPTNSKVLITGESGTGKEIVANYLHFKSNRKDGPFVKINCAAIPDELIEAELFGVEKGAFTGAIESRDGKFKHADTGTLFLDEIADMSLKTQTKVLRVLQEGEFERIGSSQIIKTDARIIAATNKDLKQLVKIEKFREDLFFRLNVLPIHIPALRERKDDIPLLINHFLEKFCFENNIKTLQMNQEVMEIFLSYKWPGNIRELKNLIERIVIMTEGPAIDVNLLPENLFINNIDMNNAFTTKKSLRALREHFESDYIRFCLGKFNGNISKTADFLMVERTYLYKKLKKLGLKN